MAVAIQIVTGCVLAALSLWLIRRCEARVRWRLIARWLMIAALIYAGFALRTSGAARWKTELAGAAMFAPAARLGAKYSLWDVWLHSGGTA